MAISDELFAIALTIAFNYVLIHKYNKFFAGIIGMGIGIATLYFGYTAGGTYNMQMGLLGIVVLMGAIATIVYDILSIYDTKQ